MSDISGRDSSGRDSSGQDGSGQDGPSRDESGPADPRPSSPVAAPTQPTLVDYGRLLDGFSLELDRLVTATENARRAGTDAEPVPGLPGISAAESARRAGETFRTARAWLADGTATRNTVRPPRRAHLPEYLRQHGTRLLAELSEDDPFRRCGSWWPQDRSSGFWRRRVLHETTVRRADVQAASGQRVAGIDSDLAADGVDEVLRAWLGFRLGELGFAPIHPARIAVDAGTHRWHIRMETGGVRVQRDGAPGGVLIAGERARVDAIVRAGPAELFRWLWGRSPHHCVQLDGDPDASAQLWVLLRSIIR